jgi:hypothetical protein
LCGSPWVPEGACFHAHLRDWLVNRPRCVFLRSGSVFHRADSPSEFLHHSRRAALSRTALPAWVLALFLTSLRRSRLPSHHSSAGANLGVLNRSSTSASKLASVFHLAARFRTASRSGGCPLHAAFSLHQAGSAHAVESSRAHLQAGCHARTPRLRRVVPHEAAGHRFGN